MYCTQEIAPNIHWVGGNDRRLALFENMFPLPNGVAYNSYLIMDEKTALIDSVDSAITRQFLENITSVLNGRTLDYLIVNHMEPDHCANIEELVYRYPNIKIVGNKKTFQMIQQFYNFSLEKHIHEVNEHDEISLGSHTLEFYFAPLVHWPEVMFCYEKTEKILFSADAFGSFGAFSGNIFNDEIDFEHDWIDEARRYYTNIVGKYGAQVHSVLNKVSGVDIQMICSLHGPIWRTNIPYIVDKYDHWSRYVPEQPGVVLAYASMYGNTENVLNVIAHKLAVKGIKNMKMFDVSKTHPSYIIAEVFKNSHLILGCPTYNSGLYFGMESLLREMAVLNLQNRKVSIVSNGSWAPNADKGIQKLLGDMKNMQIIGSPLTVRSTLKTEQLEEIDRLVDEIAADYFKTVEESQK